MKLYLATSNKNKIKEVSHILYAETNILEFFSADEIGGMPEVEETEDNFVGNARLKARALKAIAPRGVWIVADDSGLEVDVLQGRPGVHSARYAGLDATDEENTAKLLAEMEPIPDGKRSARFVCCAVLLEPSGVEKVFRDACEGVITREPSGTHGFGYDPIFSPEGFDETLAELGSGIKDRLSHRARVMKELAFWLKYTQNAYGAGV